MIGRRNGNGGKISNSTVVLLLLASIAIMVMYVEAMAFPSLPMVMNDFGLTPADYSLASWVITIYLIVGAISVPIFGKLGDIYGKKKMIMIAMVIYTIAVTLTGFSRDFSDSIYVMIGFRGFQGIGMAMFPLAFSLIRDEFPIERIAIAQGVISAMFGVGSMVGFVIGGYVTDHLGWQWTYHTVIPFIATATIIVYFKVRESDVRLKAKVDLVGAGLLGSTLFLFLVGVTEGKNRGWSDPLIMTLFLFSVASLSGFIYWQTKAKDPLIRLTLMRQRNIAISNVAAFMAGFALFTAFQTVAALAGFNFGLDATQIGLISLPLSIASLILGPSVGFLVKRVGPKWPLVTGMMISIVGFLSMYAFHSTQLEVMIGVLIMGAGNSFVMVGMINMVIISTPREETGISTAMNTIVRITGSVIGPAIAASIIASNSILVPGSGYVPTDNAYHIIFMMSAIFMGIGLVLAFFMHNSKAIGEGMPSNSRSGNGEPKSGYAQ